MRHEAQSRRDLPAVGDWVGVRWPSRQERATIQHILPRTSIFSRKVAGQETTEQIVAANVNVAFLVAGLDRDFNVRRLERYSAMTRGKRRVLPSSCSTRRTSLTDLDICRAEVGLRLPAPCRSTPSIPNPGSGLEELLSLSGIRRLPSRSSALPASASQPHQPARRPRAQSADARSDSRGRHTTTHRELMPRPAATAHRHARHARAAVMDADDGVKETFDDVATLARRLLLPRLPRTRPSPGAR